MKRKLILVLGPSALLSACTTEPAAPGGRAVSTGLAAALSESPVHAEPAGQLHQVIRAEVPRFEATEPGRLTALVPGKLRADLDAKGLHAQHRGDTISLRTTLVGLNRLDEVAPEVGGCAPTRTPARSSCAPTAELHHPGLT